MRQAYQLYSDETAPRTFVFYARCSGSYYPLRRGSMKGSLCDVGPQVDYSPRNGSTSVAL